MSGKRRDRAAGSARGGDRRARLVQEVRGDARAATASLTRWCATRSTTSWARRGACACIARPARRSSARRARSRATSRRDRGPLLPVGCRPAMPSARSRRASARLRGRPRSRPGRTRLFISIARSQVLEMAERPGSAAIVRAAGDARRAPEPGTRRGADAGDRAASGRAGAASSATGDLLARAALAYGAQLLSSRSAASTPPWSGCSRRRWSRSATTATRPCAPACLLRLAQELSFSADLERIAALLEEARRLAAATGDPALQARVALGLSVRTAARPDPTKRRSSARELVALAREGEDPPRRAGGWARWSPARCGSATPSGRGEPSVEVAPSGGRDPHAVGTLPAVRLQTCARRSRRPVRRGGWRWCAQARHDARRREAAAPRCCSGWAVRQLRDAASARHARPRPKQRCR